jgi:hypothetical protein
MLKKYITKLMSFFLGMTFIIYSIYQLNYYLSRYNGLRAGSFSMNINLPFLPLIAPIMMLILGIGFFIFGFLKSRKPLFLSILISFIASFIYLILLLLNETKAIDGMTLFALGLLFYPLFHILLFISLILLIIAYIRTFKYPAQTHS